MNAQKYLFKQLKKNWLQKKIKKHSFFKLFLYMKTQLINKIVKTTNKITRTTTYDELSSITKDILLYGLIISTIYHLIFIRTNTIIIILGCGSLYYIFRDWLDYTVTTIKKLSEKK
jgi:hypothetical protein